MATNRKTVRRRSSPTPWIIGALIGVAVALVLTVGRRPATRVATHPEPRADAANMGETVMPASFFSANPRVVRTYQLARQIPATLDGLYCNCHCKEDAGHRSLLTCFQSQHGAGCDICLEEAELAGQMQAQGRSLQDVRAQIDLAFAR
jgi:hypothetical protein